MGCQQGAGENMYGIISSAQKACIFPLDPMVMVSPRIPESLDAQLGTPDSTDPEPPQSSAFLDPGELCCILVDLGERL